MGKIIAVANQKGGVGKTTTCLNLACCVAAMGKKVLLCDFDPQSNATSGLGVQVKEGESIYDGLVAGVDVPVKKTKWCDVLPADIRLAAAEQEVAMMDDREYRLKAVLDRSRDNYDFIFIDCPPSLGMLTLNALAVCDTVLVPMQCEYYALEGLSQLVNSIKAVKKKINPNIDIEGIVLTMYDGRTNLTIQVAEEIKKYFGKKVYKTVIPRNVRLSEAPSHGLPIIAYDRTSRGAEAYNALAAEFGSKN
ncbi:MAG: ParA family protein [Clostridia bacterium]|nr:ParA family protein [Clostridia bacterium]MBR4956002.1 ParA family protein [Clostridia bacterium]MBR5902881.1 ParA family protein [Clostridia bacterium]